MIVHKPDQLITDPLIALRYLSEGNQRYLKKKLIPKVNYERDRDLLADGQMPFAVIVCCSDSRVAPEIFFDQELGDLFTIRNAGNVVDSTTLGSIEYAIEFLKSPLVVVCGHSHCGAVKAAYEGGDLPDYIRSITDRIAPAIETSKSVDEAIRKNVTLMVERIKADPYVDKNHAAVVGVYYDIVTGKVIWL